MGLHAQGVFGNAVYPDPPFKATRSEVDRTVDVSMCAA